VPDDAVLVAAVNSDNAKAVAELDSCGSAPTVLSDLAMCFDGTVDDGMGLTTMRLMLHSFEANRGKAFVQLHGPIRSLASHILRDRDLATVKSGETLTIPELNDILAYLDTQVQSVQYCASKNSVLLHLSQPTGGKVTLLASDCSVSLQEKQLATDAHQHNAMFEILGRPANFVESVF